MRVLCYACTKICVHLHGIPHTYIQSNGLLGLCVQERQNNDEGFTGVPCEPWEDSDLNFGQPSNFDASQPRANAVEEYWNQKLSNTDQTMKAGTESQTVDDGVIDLDSDSDEDVPIVNLPSTQQSDFGLAKQPSASHQFKPPLAKSMPEGKILQHFSNLSPYIRSESLIGCLLLVWSPNMYNMCPWHVPALRNECCSGGSFTCMRHNFRNLAQTSW